jgi:hypothetical protein
MLESAFDRSVCDGLYKDFPGLVLSGRHWLAVARLNMGHSNAILVSADQIHRIAPSPLDVFGIPFIESFQPTTDGPS